MYVVSQGTSIILYVVTWNIQTTFQGYTVDVSSWNILTPK